MCSSSVCECLRRGSAVACSGDRALAAAVLGGVACWHKSSWRRLPLVLTTEPAKFIGITDSMDMSLSKLQEIVKDRIACHAVVHRFIKSQTRLSN